MKLAMLGAFALAACSPPVPAPCGIDGGGTLVSGTGDPNNASAWAPLVDGETVHLVPGPQGGQHVWVQVHAANICPSHPLVRVTITRDADGAIIGFSQIAGASWMEVPGESGTYTSTPFAAAIDPDKYCTVLHGGAIHLHIHVDDMAGNELMQVVGVTVDGWSSDASAADVAAREACCADYTNTMCWPLGPPDAGATLDAP